MYLLSKRWNVEVAEVGYVVTFNAIRCRKLADRVGGDSEILADSWQTAFTLYLITFTVLRTICT